MNPRGGMWRRGATTALLGTLLMIPTAAFADVLPPSEAPALADTTTLVLRPVCRRGDLHRLAVVHDAGPATEFAVAVDGASPDDTATDMAIGEGETVHFWVDAAADTPVEITWPDGNAEATPVGGACTADGAPANPPPAGAQEPGPIVAQPPAATPAPHLPADTAADPAAHPGQAGGPSAPPLAADGVPAPDGAAPGDPSVVPGQDLADGGTTAAPPATRSAASAARQPRTAPSVVTARTPRPAPSGSAFACPGGWVVVDADGDAAIDGADRCERVFETSAEGQVSGDALPVAALVVTMVLLLTSIGIGAARWGSVMPPRR